MNRQAVAAQTALDQTGHSWISSLSSMELQTTIHPRALVRRNGVRRKIVRREGAGGAARQIPIHQALEALAKATTEY